MVALSEKETIIIVLLSQYCIIVEAAKIRFAPTGLWYLINLNYEIFPKSNLGEGMVRRAKKIKPVFPMIKFE